MTDERMTQGDVRLREEERDEIALEATYAFVNVSRLPEWMQAPALGRGMYPLGDLVAERLLPVVERIVAARVGEALMHERATRAVAIAEWERANGVPFTTLEDALRAADAPLSDDEGSGGRGDAGGDERL